MTGLIRQIALLSREVVVPLLDGSIVPYFSNNCIACMRVDFI
jgi:hypothetical protein